MIKISPLIKNPKSKVIEKGYINVYSPLTVQERRQLKFNRLYKKINSAWDSSTIILDNIFKNILLSQKNNSSRCILLDAGCGNGNYLIDENRSQIDWACGVDTNKSSTSKNICLDEIKYASLESIPYPENTCDVVLSLWVVEHLLNPEKVFTEIARVLKPGGYFLFITPNKNCLIIFLSRLLKYTGLINTINNILFGRKSQDIFPTYYRCNTMSKTKEVLKSSGLAIEKIMLNYDPGYTSFDNLTFGISNILDRAFSQINPSLFKQHIICLAQKRG